MSDNAFTDAFDMLTADDAAPPSAPDEQAQGESFGDGLEQLLHGDPRENWQEMRENNPEFNDLPPGEQGAIDMAGETMMGGVQLGLNAMSNESLGGIVDSEVQLNTAIVNSLPEVEEAGTAVGETTADYFGDGTNSIDAMDASSAFPDLSGDAGDVGSSFDSSFDSSYDGAVGAFEDTVQDTVGGEIDAVSQTINGAETVGGYVEGALDSAVDNGALDDSFGAFGASPPPAPEPSYDTGYAAPSYDTGFSAGAAEASDGGFSAGSAEESNPYDTGAAGTYDDEGF
jgi:hypothetical protein